MGRREQGGQEESGVQVQTSSKGDQARQQRAKLFAATPPLEAKKLLFSLWASMEEMCLDFTDVARAYFHARVRREMYVDLPREDHEEGMCGKLGKAMYGTRDAAQSWEVDYAEMMKEAKFKQGAYSMCVFCREERNIRAAIHGDDFTVNGRSAHLD